MTVTVIMAAALHDELRERGILGIDRAECEVIITRVIERTAELAKDNPSPTPQPGQRSH